MDDTIEVLGLSKRTILKKIKNGHLAIIKDRKSRIVMKDGKKILNEINIIKKEIPGIKVSVMTSAPLCSKTISYLEKNSIDILKLKK